MSFLATRLRGLTRRFDGQQATDKESRGDGAVAASDAVETPDDDTTAAQAAALAAAVSLASGRALEDSSEAGLIPASSEDQVALDALTQKHVPVTAREAQMISGTMRAKGAHSHSFNFAGRVFAARVLVAPEPLAEHVRTGRSLVAVSIRVVDTREDKHVMIIKGSESQVCGDGDGDNLERARARIQVGSIIAVTCPDCVNFDKDHWALVGDLDKSQLHVFAPGTRLPRLPPAEAASLVRTILLLSKEAKNSKFCSEAFQKCVFGLKEALTDDPRPCELLEDMAAAARALGRNGLALALDVAAARLLWISPRPRSAVPAAVALRGRGHVLAACKCLARCEMAADDDAALLRGVVLKLNQAEHFKRGDKAAAGLADTTANARDLAAALHECRGEWLEAPDLTAGAEAERVLDAEPPAAARARGDAAWRGGRPEAALHAWRLALRKLLSEKHGSAAPASLLAMRAGLWSAHDAFDEEQGEAEELLDNAALLMLQASTTHTANVKRALWLGAIGLGLSGADAEVERIERGALAAYDQRAVV